MISDEITESLFIKRHVQIFLSELNAFDLTLRTHQCFFLKKVKTGRAQW